MENISTESEQTPEAQFHLTPPPPLESSGWTAWVRQGLRAAVLRSVQQLPSGPSAATMLIIIATLSVISIGAARLEISGPASFNARSWLFAWAPAAIVVFGVWLVLNWKRKNAPRGSATAAWYLLYSIATLPIILFSSALSMLMLNEQFEQWWTNGHWVAWGLYIATWVWLIFVIWRVSQPFARSIPMLVTLVAYVVIANGISIWHLETAYWEPTGAEEDSDYEFIELSQEVFEAQQALLQNELKKIAPASGDERHVFGLIYAPYAEDVFLRESKMVKEVIEERFDAQGRVIRLVNNTATTEELPWATPLNLERSLRAIAAAMNKERDVLVLYLTSHGGDDFKLAAEHWPLEVQELTAARLRHMLDELQVRHRVIAVSACYSGGWIEPLKSDHTLIMTAADKDHTSYGCGSNSELTFFGRAVFDEQLRTTLSFEDAFARAVPIIKQREIDAKKDDGFSNPQISIGIEIRDVLNELAADAARH